MSYRLKYTIPFKTISNLDSVINIEELGYNGTSTELTGGSEPFSIQIDDGDDLYSPLKLSTAKIAVVGGDYLQDLFSTDYQKFRVTCLVNNVIVWTGFVKPEMYTQDYVTDVFELEIECTSALSTLEKKRYIPKGGAGTRTFVSLWWLLCRCMELSNGNYKGMYLPLCYQESSTSTENVLDKMMISEKNFYDESDEAWYWTDVLEEIMKILGWTCHDWDGSLSLQDIDAENCVIYEKNSDGSIKASSVTKNTVNVQNVGFKGNNHTLDILPGYNKISVKCNNYAISDLLPNENFSDDTKLSGLDSEEGYSATEAGEKTKSELGAFYIIHPTSYKNYVYTLFKPTDTTVQPTWVLLSETEIKNYIATGNVHYHDNRHIYQSDTYNGVKGTFCGLFGALPLRYCLYTQDSNKEASITDYSFSDLWYLRMTDAFDSKYSLYDPDTNGVRTDTVKTDRKEMLKITCEPANYSDGAFALNVKLHLNMFIPETSDVIPKYEGKFCPFTIQRDKEIHDYEFAISLRIGEYYFHFNYEQEKDSSSSNYKKLKYGNKAYIWNKDSSLTGTYTINGVSVPCTNNLSFDSSVVNKGTGATSGDYGNHFFELMSIRELTDDYNGLSGLIIPLPSDMILSGDMELTIYTPHAYVGTLGEYNLQGIHLTDLSFKYGYSQNWTSASNQTDRYYSNVINSEYINEHDEIELKISSYNNDGSCYSKLVMGDKYVTDNLYYIPLAKAIRPEELLITRYVNRYNHTRLQLKQEIEYDRTITPYSHITDSYENGKEFAVTGGNITVKNEKFEAVLTEL